VARNRIVLAVGMVAVLTAPAAPSVAAVAGADGCVNTGPDPVSCISVSGIVLYLGSVSAGVKVAIRQTVSGRFEIFRPLHGHFSMVRYGSIRRFRNPGDVHAQRFWHKFEVRRYVSAGDICARWETKTRHGFRPLPAACETIHQ
jgi:hypothetical protein